MIRFNHYLSHSHKNARMKQLSFRIVESLATSSKAIKQNPSSMTIERTDLFRKYNVLNSRSYCSLRNWQYQKSSIISNKETRGNRYFLSTSLCYCGTPIVPGVSSLAAHSNRIYPPLHSNLGSISYFSSWNQNSNRPPRIPNSKSRFGILSSGLLGSALLLGGKTKYLLGALKLTKFASLGSMMLTVGTYSIFFGVPYAVGMVSLILVHESGHALVMKHYDIPFSPMIFVPFVGATVAMNKTPRDAYQEAMIALGGPVLGSLGAFGVAGAAQLTDSQLLYALADFGFMINLFNMLPLGMMDGGRICGALSPYSGLVGLGMGGSLIYMDMITNPIFYLIMMGGAYTTFQRFYYPNNLPQNYYKITPRERAVLTGSYFGLLGFLIGCMSFNGQFKKSPEQLEMDRQRQYQLQQFQNYR